MQIVFQSRDPGGAEMRAVAIERVQFAMRRLKWLVPTARVQLSDINGSHGGVDKRCLLEFKTASKGSVVVTAVARDWGDALNSALSRAARKLVRNLQRARSHPNFRQTVSGVDS